MPPQEQHEVSMDRRMSRLPRRFDPEAKRPAPPRPRKEPQAPAPAPVEPREATGGPLTVGNVRVILGIDVARGTDEAAIVYGTVDGHGRLLAVSTTPPRPVPEEAVAQMNVREPEKATTIVINDPPPGADPLQVGLAAMRARQAQGVPRHPR